MEDTIFNYIDSILFNKRKLNTINEGETQFNLYMVNRWCSMYSPDIASIINETSNKYSQSFTLKQEQYNYCFNLFPKNKKRKIDYIKKNKEEKEKEDNTCGMLSNSLEISKRECNEYIDLMKFLNK